MGMRDILQRSVCSVITSALIVVCLSPLHALAYPADPALGPEAAIDAPRIQIERVPNTNNARLYWSHVEGTDFYEVYRATVPYPAPAANSTTNRIDDLPATGYGYGSLVEVTDNGVDRYAGDTTLATVQVIGNPQVNYFWIVQGRTSSGDVSGGSNIVGEFDFALVKGS